MSGLISVASFTASCRRRLRRQLSFPFRFQQATESVAENWMIVGDHNAYGMSSFFHHRLIHDQVIHDRSMLGLCGIRLSSWRYPTSSRAPCPGVDSIASSPARRRTLSRITAGPFPVVSSSASDNLPENGNPLPSSSTVNWRFPVRVASVPARCALHCACGRSPGFPARCGQVPGTLSATSPSAAVH